MPFSEFLTAKQVITLLRIDRTTLYRMLNDGRIKGVKIGNQWRFSKSEVDRIISGIPPETEELTGDFIEEIPYQCIVPVQDVVADIAEIGILLADKEGRQLTEISNSCKFCELIRSSEKGKAACAVSWQKLAQSKELEGRFTQCHAGLQYAMAKVDDISQRLGMLIAGQFTLHDSRENFSQEHIKNLAQKFQLNENELLEAAGQVIVLDDRWEAKISGWLKKLAKTFANLTRDRADFISRFRQIMNLSMINPKK
ncbi:MAG: helix-turn-helix domain-containing protein [Chlorobi bacterium]|nr:helix-turn-helix domain-containing protein [Chlorobiota bacterium]